jgi:methyl-accepting chemotaxis protein
MHYDWINKERGELEPRDKLVVFFPIKNWNWVLAGGTYVDEYTKESSRVMRRYELAGLAMLFVMGVGLYWIMHYRLSVPLHVATAAAVRLAGGDLTTRVEVKRIENQAVTQMDEMNQQNAALVEQAAAAAQTMEDQASTLVTASTRSRRVRPSRAERRASARAETNKCRFPIANVDECRHFFIQFPINNCI